MTQRWWFAALVLAAACGGGGSAASVAPSQSAAGTVQSFMQAVADSNLTKMAALWGSAKGPAGRTGEPSDYQRRIVVMQSYLRGDRYRIVSDVGTSDSRRTLDVELRRQGCTFTVPFQVLRLGDGTWIVNQIDLAKAGNPARPCDPAPSDSLPAQQQG